MGSTQEHQTLVDDLLLAFGSLPYVRVWPRKVGKARALSNSDYVISFGIPGESDIDGIIGPTGRKLCIEVKTGNAQLSKEQKRYRAVMERFGALYIVARDVEKTLSKFQATR